MKKKIRLIPNLFFFNPSFFFIFMGLKSTKFTTEFESTTTLCSQDKEASSPQSDKKSKASILPPKDQVKKPLPSHTEKPNNKEANLPNQQPRCSQDKEASPQPDRKSKASPLPTKDQVKKPLPSHKAKSNNKEARQLNQQQLKQEVLDGAMEELTLAELEAMLAETRKELAQRQAEWEARIRQKSAGGGPEEKQAELWRTLDLVTKAKASVEVLEGMVEKKKQRMQNNKEEVLDRTKEVPSGKQDKAEPKKNRKDQGSVNVTEACSNKAEPGQSKKDHQAPVKKAKAGSGDTAETLLDRAKPAQSTRSQATPVNNKTEACSSKPEALSKKGEPGQSSKTEPLLDTNKKTAHQNTGLTPGGGKEEDSSSPREQQKQQKSGQANGDIKTDSRGFATVFLLAEYNKGEKFLKKIRVVDPAI
jgi:hypothetical protein